MEVELFDSETEPSTSLHIATYNVDGHVIPSWWIEIPEGENYNLNEIATILDIMPNISHQLEKLLEYFS